MDIISTLPDELLVKILLLVPTNVAVSTSILSKRWEHLWMWLPKLVYGRRHCSGPECRRLRSFIDRNLPLHRAPVIETFRLELWCSCFQRENISMWVSTAVSQCVIRDLEILDKFYPAKPNVLPSNLFTCSSLVVLKLNGDIILDVPGMMVSLPSLKTLKLQGVRYPSEDTLPRLLSSSPVLENLVLKLRWYNEGKLIVVASSLPRLTLVIPYSNNIDGYVIETPSLKYLKLKDHNDKSHYCLIEVMPFLVEAYIDVMCPDIKSIVGSLKYVKRLGICSETMLDEGFAFNQLEHLDVCLCEKHSPNQLVQLLKPSPNLQVLNLFYMKGHEPRYIDYWIEPTTVPECMLSSLQSLSWSEYTGEPHERDIVVYVLKHARHLKTATIKSTSESAVLKLEMLKELAVSSRASITCQLMFE